MTEQAHFHLAGEMVVAKVPRASLLPVLVPLGVEASVDGTVFITQAQTYFCVAETGGLLVSVPHGTLERVKKIQGKEKRQEPYIVEIACKDLRSIRFVLPGKLLYKQMVSTLESLAYELEMSALFAFKWKPMIKYPEWRYDAQQEYSRCGLDRGDHRLTSINQHYAICDSYPQLLAVPAKATDELLCKVAEFRSRGRMPVATYLWSDSGAALYRCSQPLVGLKNTKCPEDERLLDLMSTLPVRQSGVHLHIVDARPKVAAVGNKFLGAGMEHVGPGTRYEGCSLEYLNIGNIHTMRGALQKLMEALEVNEPRKQEQGIERSDWKDHLTRILSGATRICNVLISGSPVLVHCTDGWDRTAQLTCLTQMILDPYYRTMEGLAVLVEKEWLSFGHKFAQRHGHGTFSPKWKDTQRAPIFLQFVDCCWQLSQQYPTSFEWNERHLMMMVDACYSNVFGTFLCNTDQERRILYKVYDGTVSLWAYLKTHRAEYVNEHFEPDQGRLMPKLSGIQVWRTLYCRYQWSSVNELAGIPVAQGSNVSVVSFNAYPRLLRSSAGRAPHLRTSLPPVQRRPHSPDGAAVVKERIMTRQGRSESVTLDDIDGARRRRVSWEYTDNESLSMVPELSDEDENDSVRPEVLESFAEPILDHDSRSEVLDWNTLNLEGDHANKPHTGDDKEQPKKDDGYERIISPRQNAAKRRGVKFDVENLKLGLDKQVEESDK